MKIGILALQGGYEAHTNSLTKLGISNTLVRRAEEFADLDGLIIPGGESSTLIKLINTFELLSALKHFHQLQKPLFGTCAGMILLAQTVIPQQMSLQCIDILVERNAYGRQCDSFIAHSDMPNHSVFKKSVELVFIRAPKVLEFSNKVTPLLTHKGEAVLLEQQHILVASFHPELTEDNTIHAYFVEMVKKKQNALKPTFAPDSRA